MNVRLCINTERTLFSGIPFMKNFLLLCFVSALFAADGSMERPRDYREWVFLSSGLGMTYGPVASQERRENPFFENVFVNPEAYRSFVANGKWPDKTTMVLEIRASASQVSINKEGRVQGDIVAVETEVKDNGKWTFYGFGKDGASAQPMPASATCYSCHAKNGAVDNTFVQFYPVLRAIAKEKGTLKE